MSLRPVRDARREPKPPHLRPAPLHPEEVVPEWREEQQLLGLQRPSGRFILDVALTAWRQAKEDG